MRKDRFLGKSSSAMKAHLTASDSPEQYLAELASEIALLRSSISTARALRGDLSPSQPVWPEVPDPLDLEREAALAAAPVAPPRPAAPEAPAVPLLLAGFTSERPAVPETSPSFDSEPILLP